MDPQFKEHIEAVNNATEWSDVLNEGKTSGTIKCPFCHQKGKGYLYPNFFKCFSSRCNVMGDKIVVYKLLNNLSYGDALRQLENNSSLDFDTQQQEMGSRNELLNEVVDAYADKIEEHPEVIEYLISRGFREDFIRQQRIGYAPTNKTLSIYGFSSNKLRRHQLATKKGDFFWERIIFPIYNYNGYLVHLTGRKFPSVPGEEFKYLDSRAVPIIGSSKDYLLFEQEIKLYKNGTKTLYLVEGVPDSFILKQNGAAVVGVMGLAKLMSHTSKFDGFNKIVAIFDNDRFDLDHPNYPGQLKSWRMVTNQLIDLQLYLGKKINIEVCMVPEDLYHNGNQVKDVNDLFLYVNQNRNELLRIIKENTVDLIEDFLGKHGSDTSYHKTALKLIAATNRGRDLMEEYITSDWKPLDYALKVLIN